MSAAKREFDVNAKPLTANVIVLEDHDDTSQCICQKLREHGMTVFHAKNLDEFEKGLKGGEFDVGSVDWNIDGLYQGQQALAQLEAYDPTAGKVVFSVHADEEEVVQRAMSERADFVLEKLGSDYEHYLVTVGDAARLGLCRRIAEELKQMGRWTRDLSNRSSLICVREESGPEWLSCSLDESVEADLCIEGRKASLETALAGQESELMSLMKKRGWWAVFDSDAYAQSPWHRKMAQLFGYVGGSTEDLAQILNIEVTHAQELLSGDDGALFYRMPEIIGESDKLLSILAYVLRLSDYEPELMPYLWETKALFRESLNSPPWDALGLFSYLKLYRVAGINDALVWIRRH